MTTRTNNWRGASELLRELLMSHTRKRDVSACIDALWDETGKALDSKGVTLSEVEDAIGQVRAGRGQTRY